MRTEVARPHSDPRPRRRLVYLGEAAMVVGLVLTVLGILGIGGLFNLGVGLTMIWVGSIPALLEESRLGADLDSEFRRYFDAP